jgi:hypothetical protein
VTRGSEGTVIVILIIMVNFMLGEMFIFSLRGRRFKFTDVEI